MGMTVAPGAAGEGEASPTNVLSNEQKGKKKFAE